MTMSPPPPPAAQNFSMQPRSNGPALASFICALVGFCVPVVGGLLGIILGFVGLKRSKETASGGGLAIAGIIIGIVTLLGWAGVGVGIYKGSQALVEIGKAPRDAARQYVVAVSKGDVDAALNDSTGITKEEIAAEVAIIQPLGNFVDMTSVNFNMNNNVCTLIGSATFSNGVKGYTINLSGSGKNWKVTSVVFQ